MKQKLHLISNAHLDPVWLWQWEEGVAEAISTFRAAADFCEEYDGYIFNHNEVILYQWIEEYEPELFTRIQSLVKAGKWHIMGGWYLQPDCNMPSGESFVRQILLGRTYFKEKFGTRPTTAINFDPFGHTRGLVQILKKSGYDSYLFCRPLKKSHGHTNVWPDDFIWVGYDGSEVLAHRAFKSYGSRMGQARKKVEEWIRENQETQLGMVLWGVGNHGGGPSRIDLNDLQDLMNESDEIEIIHSTPEEYFEDLKSKQLSLPKREKDLNPWAIGGYTSQIRIKQKHRLLENEIFMAEKMASHAFLKSGCVYPAAEIHEAMRVLAISEFHDILPGTQIQPTEEDSLRMLGHGLELMSQVKTKAFFTLMNGQEKARDKEFPIFIYNPHPFKIKGIFECEFQIPAAQRPETSRYSPVVYYCDKRVPCQAERGYQNNPGGGRKHVVFEAELEPSQMNRFNYRIENAEQMVPGKVQANDEEFLFTTDELEVVINRNTGLIDRYRANGVDYVKEKAFLPIVIEDDDHSIATFAKRFRDVAGEFKLMSQEEGTRFSGVYGTLLDSVRIIEDGPVRTVIEAVLSYGYSFLCLNYILPKHGTEIEVSIRVYWNENNKMLKLSIPTAFEDAKYIGQVAYGVDELPDNGDEVVAQKWVAAVSEKNNYAVTCINDGIYGSDFCNGEIRLSLLRSPRFGCLIAPDKRDKLYNDRHISHIDQGERIYHFWFNGGRLQERRTQIDREALMHNEKPFVLSFFPSGAGEKPMPMIVLDDDAVQVSAFKKAESSEHYIIRLFEPTGQDRQVNIKLPILSLSHQIKIGRYEIKTLKLDLATKTLNEVDLMEG